MTCPRCHKQLTDHGEVIRCRCGFFREKNASPIWLAMLPVVLLAGALVLAVAA